MYISSVFLNTFLNTFPVDGVKIEITQCLEVYNLPKKKLKLIAQVVVAVDMTSALIADMFLLYNIDEMI